MSRRLWARLDRNGAERPQPTRDLRDIQLGFDEITPLSVLRDIGWIRGLSTAALFLGVAGALFLGVVAAGFAW